MSETNDIVPGDNTPGIRILDIVDVDQISATIAQDRPELRAWRSDRHPVDADSN
jgi:hypothetical protein